MARKLLRDDVDRELLERVSSYAWEQLHLGTGKKKRKHVDNIHICVSRSVERRQGGMETVVCMCMCTYFEVSGEGGR